MYFVELVSNRKHAYNKLPLLYSRKKLYSKESSCTDRANKYKKKWDQS